MIDATGASALLVGLFTAAVGLGALRTSRLPALITDPDERSAVMMLTGLAELSAGALLVLANPWRDDDLVAALMTAIGAVMIVEALIITAFGDRYARITAERLARAPRGFAIATLGAGALLALVGLLRLA